MNITQQICRKNDKETIFIFHYGPDVIRTVLPNNLLPSGIEERQFRLVFISGYTGSCVITIKSNKITSVRNAFGDDFRLPGWKMKVAEHVRTGECPE